MIILSTTIIGGQMMQSDIEVSEQIRSLKRQLLSVNTILFTFGVSKNIFLKKLILLFSKDTFS